MTLEPAWSVGSAVKNPSNLSEAFNSTKINYKNEIHTNSGKSIMLEKTLAVIGGNRTQKDSSDVPEKLKDASETKLKGINVFSINNRVDNSNKNKVSKSKSGKYGNSVSNDAKSTEKDTKKLRKKRSPLAALLGGGIEYPASDEIPSFDDIDPEFDVQFEFLSAKVKEADKRRKKKFGDTVLEFPKFSLEDFGRFTENDFPSSLQSNLETITERNEVSGQDTYDIHGYRQNTEAGDVPTPPAYKLSVSKNHDYVPIRVNTKPVTLQPPDRKYKTFGTFRTKIDQMLKMPGASKEVSREEEDEHHHHHFYDKLYHVHHNPPPGFNPDAFRVSLPKLVNAEPPIKDNKHKHFHHVKNAPVIIKYDKRKPPASTTERPLTASEEEANYDEEGEISEKEIENAYKTYDDDALTEVFNDYPESEETDEKERNRRKKSKQRQRKDEALSNSSKYVNNNVNNSLERPRSWNYQYKSK